MNKILEMNDVCKEVFIVLSHLDNKLLEKIPNKFLKFLTDQAADSNYDFYINPNKDLDEQDLSEESKDLLSSFNTQYYNNLSNDDNLFIAESKAIKNIADKGGCVIVGRCSNYVLKDNPNVINIFLYSDDKNKIKRAVKYYGLDEKLALKEIKRINKNREKHYNYYTHEKWKNIDNYDLSMNVDKLGVEKTAKFIAEFIINKNKELAQN